MTPNRQLVISLSKLSLPADSNIKKVVLSVVSSPFEAFIQNSKIVKCEKINFYRQNLFIQQSSERLQFNIYEVELNGTKKLVITLVIEKQELCSIQRKPKAFKTSSHGFELAWESWLFVESSSYLSQQSSRDYTQLDLPLDHLRNSHILNSSMSQNFQSIIDETHAGNILKKRSSSTERATFQFQNNEDQENENSFLEGSPEKNSKKSINLVSPAKKRSKVGVQIFSNLTSGRPSLLTQ